MSSAPVGSPVSVRGNTRAAEEKEADDNHTAQLQVVLRHEPPLRTVRGRAVEEKKVEDN